MSLKAVDLLMLTQTYPMKYLRRPMPKTETYSLVALALKIFFVFRSWDWTSMKVKKGGFPKRRDSMRLVFSSREYR